MEQQIEDYRARFFGRLYTQDVSSQIAAPGLLLGNSGVWLSVPIDFKFIMRGPGRLRPGETSICNPYIPSGRCAEAILPRLRRAGIRCLISHDCPGDIVRRDLDFIPVIPGKLELYLRASQCIRFS